MKEKIKRPLACFSVLFFLSTAADLWVVSDLQAQPSDTSACDSAYKSLEDLVVPKPQETNMWCWAAVAEMVMARYGKYVEQCVQVTDAYRDEIHVRSCCDDDNRWTPECNRPGWPHFSDYGFHVDIDRKESGIGWNRLKGEICENRPFIYTLESVEGRRRTSHQYVAIGYKKSRTRGREVLVINPMGYYPTPADVAWILFTDHFRLDPDEGVWHAGTLLDIHPE